MFNPIAFIIAAGVITGLLFGIVELDRNKFQNDIKNFETSFSVYEKSQSDINRNVVIKSATVILAVDVSDELWFPVIDNALSVLIKKKDWVLVNALYNLNVKVEYLGSTNDYHDIYFSNKAINLIGKYYKDEDFKRKFKQLNHAKALYLVSAGEKELAEGNLNKAYNLFAKAGITYRNKAVYVKGLAVHYGCSNLAEVWGGLVTVNKHFEGSVLKPDKITLTNNEIAKARLELKKDILPTIDESCPIFNN